MLADDAVCFLQMMPPIYALVQGAVQTLSPEGTKFEAQIRRRACVPGAVQQGLVGAMLVGAKLLGLSVKDR